MNKYEVYLYDLLLGGWWPNEPTIPKNTAFLYRSLTPRSLSWTQRSSPVIVGPTDSRSFGIFDLGKDSFTRKNLLQVWVTQKAGENASFQYSTDNGVSWTEFSGWGPPSVDQTTSAYWTVAEWAKSGLIRVHLTK